MKRNNLKILNVADLVDLFAALGVLEDQAEKTDDGAERNRLIRHMFAISDELKSREGDQRRALLQLYSHRNMAVRLKAAKSTLAVAPTEARQMIESIATSRWMPHAGDAGMCLLMLDSGRYVPD